MNLLEQSQPPPTFLVVDDDPIMRRVLVSHLEPLAHTAIYDAEDGIAAQKFLLQHSVDVVVTDVLMPNMDGRELMEWAKHNAPGAMWIVLSGLDTFDAAVDALHLGAFDFIAKPADPQRLHLSVRNALEQLELRRDRERLYAELVKSHDNLAEKVQQLETVCEMLEEQSRVIQGDLKRAEVIQRALLPSVPPKIGRWCIETLYRPGSNVGGDYFDVVNLDDRHLGIVLADAAGHGVAAAMLTVLLKHRLVLTDQAGEPLPPSAVLATANERLMEDVTGPGMFITAVYALLDRRSGKLVMAAAGHPPSLWVNQYESRQFSRTGPALGLRRDAEYDQETVMLEQGDRMFFYTDGVIEGGPDSPTLASLTADLQGTSQRAETLNRFFEDASRGVASDRDDITMILLERGDGESRFDSDVIDEPTVPKTEIATPHGNVAIILQGVVKGHAFLSLAGDLTWTRSNDFFEAATKLLKKRRSLTIDLGACEYLDSTFLGTIHEVVMLDPHAVRLQRVPAKIRSLFDELDMVGVLAQISVLTDPLPEEMTPLSEQMVEDQQQGQRVLRAHEILATLSDENQQRFKSVVESLRADLNSPDQPQSSSPSTEKPQG